MNIIYRSVWNDKLGLFVTVSENTKSVMQKNASRASVTNVGRQLILTTLAISLVLVCRSIAYAGPGGGIVTSGGANINNHGVNTTITQSNQHVVINWQSFNVAVGESVKFIQPNSNSVALNRVIGADPSSILGSLTANGKVFLINPNGILFGLGASVNVGGLVASTLNIKDSDFMAGNYQFAGTSKSTILNQGTINTNIDGGYVALLGANVNNQGAIMAKFGTVALAAGSVMTLDVDGDGLQNGCLIQANGGHALMTAQATTNLFQSVVNNSGIIEAQSIGKRNGTIALLGGMQNGTVNVSGTLDASAPTGGNGGTIETSAANVFVTNNAKITTAAPQGAIGTWLIDPLDFTVDSSATANISGAALSALLVTNSVVISTANGSTTTTPGSPPVTSLNTTTTGNGDININQAVTWTAAPSTTTLSLNAARDVNINAAVTTTNGNVAVCCGRDVNINAAIVTTNGSVLLSGGRDVNLNAVAALTTTDGNIMMCAGNNLNIGGAITLTRGSIIPAQSLGLPQGLVLNAGIDGTGPGVAGGTVIFAPLTPPITVTGPNAPVTIDYNPVSYSTPTDYSSHFVLTSGSTLKQYMLVFATGGDKIYDGTTATTLTSLQGSPAGVTLVASPSSNAIFDTADIGTAKAITFTGYSLTGTNATDYALPVSCCGPNAGSANTIGAISAPPVVIPPVVVPPVVVPPVVVPPVVEPPLVAPPVVVPPVVVPPVVVPPVVVPPVVVPPVVVPPVVVPPVVVPPVVVPPVVVPPVVVPPVVVPPVVEPPVVVPPVVEPPVVVPPVVVPPVVEPPVVVPPVVVPPVVEPPVVEPPVVVPPVVVPPVVVPPVVVQSVVPPTAVTPPVSPLVVFIPPDTPPQLLTIVPPVIAPMAPPVVTPSVVILVPPPPPAVIYVAPQRKPKPERH